VVPVAGGYQVTLTIGDVSGVPILDDCAIAESRAINCPRNLYAGRALVYKHGSCSPVSFLPTADRRVYLYPSLLPVSGVQSIVPNWTQYSEEDLNLNGLLDPGEDGANGGVVNGRLDPVIIAGTAATSRTLFVPAVPAATDCIYFGMTLALDANHFFVNPPTNTISGETVLGPVVSVMPLSIRAGSASAASDEVIELRASKSQGKGSVDWTTGVELTTSGFNVIGAKKGGGEVKINANLIAAKEGTTGKGASYSLSFDAGQLKGSSSVYVEVVKNDGSKERFGPAAF